jgi:hypothetical protein
MRLKTLLARLPPVAEVLRPSLERALAELGALPLVEVVEDAEDAEWGLMWQKRSRGVSLAVFPDEVLAVQWKERAGRMCYRGPFVRIEGPDDLLPLLRWMLEAPRDEEWDYY